MSKFEMTAEQAQCCTDNHRRYCNMPDTLCNCDSLELNYETAWLRTENATLTLALAESHRVLRGALRCVTECGCGACQRNIKAILATTPTPSEKAGEVCENPRHDCPCPECAPTNPNRV